MVVVIQSRIGHRLYARLKCRLSIGFSHELLGDVHQLGILYLQGSRSRQVQLLQEVLLALVRAKVEWDLCRQSIVI